MSGEKFNDKHVRMQELALNITFLPVTVEDDAVASCAAESLEPQPCKTTLGSVDTNTFG